MSKGRPRNVAASVRQRLADAARERGEEFQLVLARHAIERLLYRLSRSAHAPDFVLKGAMLFQLWDARTHRPTRDLDLLGRGEPSLARVRDAFRDVCGTAVEDDGWAFDPESVAAERIKEDQEYEGVRVTCRAVLGQARVALQIDVGFGDAVTPRAAEATYPALLDLPAPVLRAYPMPTVVAEKFQAMIALGIANSRMKDFYDLWFLAGRFGFDGPTLGRALAATFRRRKTPLPPAPPLALTPEFGTDPAKIKQWQAFVRKSRLDVAGLSLEQVCAFLGDFLMPPAAAVQRGEEFDRTWPPGGPWSGE